MVGYLQSSLVQRSRADGLKACCCARPAPAARVVRRRTGFQAWCSARLQVCLSILLLSARQRCAGSFLQRATSSEVLHSTGRSLAAGFGCGAAARGAVADPLLLRPNTILSHSTRSLTHLPSPNLPGPTQHSTPAPRACGQRLTTTRTLPGRTSAPCALDTPYPLSPDHTPSTLPSGCSPRPSPPTSPSWTHLQPCRAQSPAALDKTLPPMVEGEPCRGLVLLGPS